MLLGREVEGARRTPTPQLDIGALVGAVGHVVGEDVRDPGELGVERGDPRAHQVLVGLDLALEGCDLGDRRIGLTAAGAQPADLTRERVAARLALLQPGLERPDRDILLEQQRRHGREAPAHECPVERVGLITQPLQVEHVMSRVAMASACEGT